MVKTNWISKKLKRQISSFAMFKNGNIYQEIGGKKKFFNKFIYVFLMMFI